MTISYGNDVDYAQAKLTDSVVKVDNYPVHVLGVETSDSVRVKKLLDKNYFYVKLNDLDLEPLRLGYANYGNEACYVTRLPQRSWKQGIRNSNMWSPKIRVPIESPSFVNLVLNNYPSLTLCLEYLDCVEVKTIAFSKHFALGLKEKRGFKVFYKNFAVGYLDPQKSWLPKLDDSKQYLKELTEETFYV